MENIANFVLVTGVLAAILITLREFWCWYWKQNEICNYLKSIDEALKKINSDKAEEVGKQEY